MPCNRCACTFCSLSQPTHALQPFCRLSAAWKCTLGRCQPCRQHIILLCLALSGIIGQGGVADVV